MPTTVTRTIGSGGDYTTIGAWAAAIPTNLVTADQIWRGELLNQEFTGSFTVSGITTDATRYIELTAAAGASYADHADKLTNALRYNASNGAAIRATADYTDALTITANYTRISRIQVKALENGRAISLSGTDVTVENCIAEAGTHSIQAASGGVKTFRNVVGIRTTAGGSYGWYIPTGTIYIYNCAMIRSSNQSPTQTAFFQDYSSANTIKNCVAFGFSTFAAITATVANNNASDLASVPGTSAQASLSYAATFEQPSNASSALDLRTKAGAALIDNGADLSGVGVTTDLVGTARGATYDIGPWEVAASGTTGSGAVTLGAATASGAGALAITGAAANTLGSAAAAGVAALAIAGTASGALGGLTGSGAGALAIAATGAATLGAASAAGVGTLAITGAGGGTLGAVSLGQLAGNGDAVLPISGTLAVTLGALTVVATDAARSPTPASRRYTLPAAPRAYTLPAAARRYTVQPEG